MFKIEFGREENESLNICPIKYKKSGKLIEIKPRFILKYKKKFDKLNNTLLLYYLEEKREREMKKFIFKIFSI